MILEPLKKPVMIEGHDRKIFNYNYYASNNLQFEILSERWNGQEDRLAKIINDIQIDDHLWCSSIRNFNNEPLADICEGRGTYAFGNSTEAQSYRRDLRGLKIINWAHKEHFSASSYTNFSFCLFSKCHFIQSTRKGMLFFQSSISSTKFESCSFKNGWFFEGDMKDTVFYDCSFDDVVFNMNSTDKEQYERIVFINCNFKNCDLSRINLRSCCFVGHCDFSSLIMDPEDIKHFSSIGTELLKVFHQWDCNDWPKRKHIKSVTYAGLDEPIVNYFDKNAKQPNSKNHTTTKIAFIGLIRFYEYAANTYDNHTHRDVFARAHYVLSWLIDDKYAVDNPFKGFFRMFIGRHIAGYGDRPLTPILAWFINIVIFSILLSLSGIVINNQTITLLSSWDSGGLNEALSTTLKALYFSTITATTVGYGDIQPSTGLSMLFCALDAAIGILLYTTFTVVMVRRLFK